MNKLIKRAKETKHRVLEIFAFAESSELAVIGWGTPLSATAWTGSPPKAGCSESCHQNFYRVKKQGSLS